MVFKKKESPFFLLIGRGEESRSAGAVEKAGLRARSGLAVIPF